MVHYKSSSREYDIADVSGLQTALDSKLNLSGSNANQDVNIGAYSLNAASIKINGTNGLGHIHLKHQASDATSQANSTTLFADSNGNIKYKNDNLYYTTFITNGNSANRAYTFQNASGTLAFTSDITSSLANYVPYSGASQDVDLGQRRIYAGYTVPQVSGLAGTFNYGNSGYSASYYTHGLQVYSYKTMPNGKRAYSDPVQVDITDDGYALGTYIYDISWSWSLPSGIDGVIVFKYDSSSSFNYDYYYDLGLSSGFTDNSSGAFSFGSHPTIPESYPSAFNSLKGGLHAGSDLDAATQDILILQWGGYAGAMPHSMVWSNPTANDCIKFLDESGNPVSAQFDNVAANTYTGTSYMTNYGNSYGTHYGSVYSGGASGLAVWSGGSLGYSANPQRRAMRFDVQNAKLPTSNPARIDAADQNWRLLFDASTSQSAMWQFIMPQDYNSSLVLRLHFSMNATQTGTNAVVWRGYIAAITPSVDAVDVNAKSFASANSGTATLANNQTAGYVRTITITLSNADSVAASDFVMLKIDRDASNVSDTATGDAELIGISLEYISAL